MNIMIDIYASLSTFFAGNSRYTQSTGCTFFNIIKHFRCFSFRNNIYNCDLYKELPFVSFQHFTVIKKKFYYLVALDTPSLHACDVYDGL